MIQRLMSRISIVLAADTESGIDTFNTSGSEAEASSKALFSDLPSNLRIIILILVGVLFYIITRVLYEVLINKKWHPANARLLSFSTLAILWLGVFTLLFIGIISHIIIIFIWAVLIIMVILFFLKRHK